MARILLRCWAVVMNRPFRDPPSGKPETIVVGVTGTKGKTSTSHFVWQLLKLAGRRAAVSTTEGTRITSRRVLQPCRSLEDLTHLAVLCQHDDVDHVVVELTSFALANDLHRVVSPSCVVFTNIGGDHIRQHGNRRNYVAAKRKLFRDVDVTASGLEPWAVLNADDPFLDMFEEALGADVRLCSYAVGHPPPGSRSSVRLWADEVKHHASGTSWTLHGLPGGSLRCSTRLYGTFNVSNVLAAIGCAVAEGVDGELAVQSTRALRPPPGRFEIVDAEGDGQPAVIVDFAHTAESLEAVLLSARGLRPRGQLTVVFGLGADTYTAKRAQMGEVAGRLADRMIITTDNPETDDPRAIAEAIVRGIPRAARVRSVVELDRTLAIERAIVDAAPTDAVLIAGMGTQLTIDVAGELRRHCDLVVAKAALRRRTAVAVPSATNAAD